MSGVVLFDNQVARSPFDNELGLEVFVSRGDQEAHGVLMDLFESGRVYLDRSGASGVGALADKRQETFSGKAEYIGFEPGDVHVDLPKKVFVASYSCFPR